MERKLKIQYLKALAAGNTKEAERLKIEIETKQFIISIH